MNDRQRFDGVALVVGSFRQQNLRGRSFRGKDLSEQDFTGADIRGADFTNAILRNANFAQVQAGLPIYKAMLLSILMLLICGLLGVLAGFIGATIGLQFYAAGVEIPAKALALMAHIGFLLIALRKGIMAGFNIFALALMLAFTAALIHSAAIPIAGAIAIAIVIDFCVASITVMASVVAVVTRIAVNAKIAWVVAVTFPITFALTLWQTRTANSAIAIAATVMLLSLYVSWRTLRRQPNVRALGSTLFSRWGTSFRGADLTGAYFFRAKLPNSDFRQALLADAHWDNSPADAIASF